MRSKRFGATGASDSRGDERGCQRGFQAGDPVGRGVGVEQDRDRLHQAETGADDEQQRRRGLGDRRAAERIAQIRRNEHDGAEQDVHRDLRRHDHLEGFGLGADFDVGRGLRHIQRVVEQIVAARGIEPHLLEAVEEVDQPVEQPALPRRRFALLRGQPLILDGGR